MMVIGNRREALLRGIERLSYEVTFWGIRIVGYAVLGCAGFLLGCAGFLLATAAVRPDLFWALVGAFKGSVD